MSKLEANSKKRIGLGRGLGALLDDTEQVQRKGLHASDFAGSLDTVNLMEEISLDLIETNPFQPREHFEQDALQDLAESIRLHGIIQPITVRKIAPRKFQLISGERRLQASKIAGLNQIPAYVRTADDQQMIEMALIENIQRENLNPIEEANGIQRLIEEFNMTHESAAQAVGRSRSAVTNLLRLQNLHGVVQEMLAQAKLDMGHARALLMLDGAKQIAAAEEIVQNQLSVRAAEQLVKKLSSAVSAPTKAAAKDRDVLRLQETLAQRLGAAVAIDSSKNGSGTLKIRYASLDQLDEILSKIH